METRLLPNIDNAQDAVKAAMKDLKWELDSFGYPDGVTSETRFEFVPRRDALLIDEVVYQKWAELGGAKEDIERAITNQLDEDRWNQKGMYSVLFEREGGGELGVTFYHLDGVCMIYVTPQEDSQTDR